MSELHKNTWETYVSAWNHTNPADKRFLFEKCLDSACRYNDPLIMTKGWDELQAYMLDFHKQFPGGYFETHYFLAHSGKSIAKWRMKTADHSVMSEGISYGEYNKDGLLVGMTGFFETPSEAAP